MRRDFLLLVLLAFGLALAGCDNPPPKKTVVDFSQFQEKEAAKKKEFGNGIRVKFITTNPSRGHDWREKEAQRQMEEFVNSGQYDIVQVVTVRCTEGNAHLLAAEVYYREKK